MSTPFAEELIRNARAIAAPGKGILAADESTGTIGSRFKAIDVENTEANRKNYRELLITTEGLEEHISGIILFEETLYQSTNEGTPFIDILNKKGILAGIKVRLRYVGILNLFSLFCRLTRESSLWLAPTTRLSLRASMTSTPELPSTMLMVLVSPSGELC